MVQNYRKFRTWPNNKDKPSLEAFRVELGSCEFFKMLREESCKKLERGKKDEGSV